MALLSAYTDVTYANSVNQGKAEWDGASSAQKNDALVKSRYYIDSHYTCVTIPDMDLDDLTTVPDELQYANALLANEYLAQTLYAYDETGGQSIVKKAVKAGSVGTDVTYSGFMKENVKRGDPYPEVTAILSVYCSRGASSGSLTRV